MRITESQLRKIVREEILKEGPSIQWKEGQMGRMYHETPDGTYDWSPSTGHLAFVSNKDGRRTILSSDTSPKRSGGFHNMKSQEEVDTRVQAHMRKIRQ
jgi:hypothetical protein